MPLSCRGDPRLELRLLDQAITIRIDKSRNALLNLHDQLGNLIGLAVTVRLLPLAAPLVLGPDPVGLRQQAAHILPYGGVQVVGTDHLVPAQALPTRSELIGAQAAVIRVRLLGLGISPLQAVGRTGVPASLADHQPLKQIAVAARFCTLPQPILFELRLDCNEELFSDQCGNRDPNLILSRRIRSRNRAPWMFRLATLGSQPFSLEGLVPRLAVGGGPDVRSVPQDSTDRGRSPDCFSCRAENPLPPEAPPNLSQRTPLTGNPVEDLSNHPCFTGHDLKACFAV